MHFDAVFFDVDGTLIDSAPGIRETFAYTFQQLGIDDTGVDYNQFFGPPLRRSYAKFLSTPEKVEEAVELYRVYYHDKGSHNCKVYPGVREMLLALREAGLIVCTATSKPVEVVTPILQEHGLYSLFHRVGGASQDASIDTKTAVIKKLLEDELLQNKRILMVGDRRDDMIGAADCGLAAAGVLYGYGSLDELAPYKPLFLANTCDEITRSILEGSSK